MSPKIKCFFHTFHEYRFSYGMYFITGILTGLTDALLEDFTVKAFLWASFLMFLNIVQAYELSVMEAPEKPRLQSILLCIMGLLALLSTHHFVWLWTCILIGKEIDDPLWLAPGVYVSFKLYTAVMSLALIASLKYLFYINICSRD